MFSVSLATDKFGKTRGYFGIELFVYDFYGETVNKFVKVGDFAFRNQELIRSFGFVPNPKLYE